MRLQAKHAFSNVAGSLFLWLASMGAATAHEPTAPTNPPKIGAAQRLPLGDGKTSSSPRQGYVLTCNSRFGGRGGAHRIGEWIDAAAALWDPSSKPQVEGQIVWPNAAITVTREADFRVVRSNNLPLHPSGQFPVRPGSKAFEYDRNPNVIREHSILLRLPAEPLPASQPNCVPMGMIGFALSGVAIYNAFDALGRDAPAYEIQDQCNGHPERRGQYHYHDWSPCLAKDATGRPYAADEPVGWMLDGFPILGPLDDTGRAITNADLDECHGKVGKVRIDGQIKTLYHYRFTKEYPYTIGCFKGPMAQRFATP